MAAPAAPSRSASPVESDTESETVSPPPPSPSPPTDTKPGLRIGGHQVLAVQKVGVGYRLTVVVPSHWELMPEWVKAATDKTDRAVITGHVALERSQSLPPDTATVAVPKLRKRAACKGGSAHKRLGVEARLGPRVSAFDRLGQRKRR